VPQVFLVHQFLLLNGGVRVGRPQPPCAGPCLHPPSFCVARRDRPRVTRACSSAMRGSRSAFSARAAACSARVIRAASALSSSSRDACPQRKGTGKRYRADPTIVSWGTSLTRISRSPPRLPNPLLGHLRVVFSVFTRSFLLRYLCDAPSLQCSPRNVVSLLQSGALPSQHIKKG